MHLRNLASRCKNTYNIVFFALRNDKRRSEFYSFTPNVAQKVVDETSEPSTLAKGNSMMAYLKR